jgi:glycosyltransferase involved in cell wall biosynthesis
MHSDRDPSRALSILMLESSRHWGGQEDRLIREARWLCRKGHRVMLACNPDAAIAPRARAAGVDVRPVPMRANVDVPGLRQLYSLVRREKPDVLHAHSSKDAWFAFWFHCRGIPVVRSRHMTLPDTMRRGRRFIYRHGCRRLIASAQFIADNMRNSIGVAPGRIDVIGECVDTEEFQPGDGSAFRREFGIPSDAPLFGIVAMLRGEKGHRTFLHAADEVLRSHPNARFAVVGGPVASDSIELELREILRKKFSGLDPQPVVMTGFREDIANVMRAIDCLVVPSAEEAQTLVIPQAFATRKPVIGSRVGGIPELVEDGATGMLIPPQDPAALAAAMDKIITQPEPTNRMAQAGYDLARRELAIDTKMHLLVGSYRKAIAPRA